MTENHTCINCGRNFKYLKAFEKHQIKCQENKEEKKNEDNDTPPENQNPETPENVDIDVINANIDENFKKESKIQISKPISEENFQDIFSIIPNTVNKILAMIISKDSDYFPLVEIWKFSKSEIEELSSILYSILKTFFPGFLVILGASGVVKLITYTVAIGLIFVPKIEATAKLVKEIRSNKNGKKKIENQERETGTDGRSTGRKKA